MRHVLRAVYKLIGVILIALGLFIVAVSWTAHFGMWPNWDFLSFLQNTITWSILLTIVGGFIVALGVVFARV